jgi:hypothetical protein
MLDQGAFQVLFVVMSPALQSEELQHHGVLDDFLRRFWQTIFPGYRQHGRLVVTQQQALVETGSDLPLQLPACPEVVECFQLVVLTFMGIVDTDQ